MAQMRLLNGVVGSCAPKLVSTGSVDPETGEVVGQVYSTLSDYVVEAPMDAVVGDWVGFLPDGREITKEEANQAEVWAAGLLGWGDTPGVIHSLFIRRRDVVDENGVKTGISARLTGNRIVTMEYTEWPLGKVLRSRDEIGRPQHRDVSDSVELTEEQWMQAAGWVASIGMAWTHPPDQLYEIKASYVGDGIACETRGLVIRSPNVFPLNFQVIGRIE